MFYFLFLIYVKYFDLCENQNTILCSCPGDNVKIFAHPQYWDIHENIATNPPVHNISNFATKGRRIFEPDTGAWASCPCLIQQFARPHNADKTNHFVFVSVYLDLQFIQLSCTLKDDFLIRRILLS